MTGRRVQITKRRARGLIFDLKGDLLLSKVIPFDGSLGTHIWVTLGGSVEEGESTRECLARELQEELGNFAFNGGKCIWIGRHSQSYVDELSEVEEHFFMVTVHELKAEFKGITLQEKQITLDLRWWKRDEILRSGEVFVPRNMPDLLSNGFEDGDPIVVDLSI